MSEMGSKTHIGLHVQYPLLLLILMKISLQILEKYANIKFNENTSNGSRVDPCGETDRHDEANSRFSQFWESIQKTKHLQCIRRYGGLKSHSKHPVPLCVSTAVTA